MVRHREKPDEGLDAAFRQVLARSEAEALSIPTSTVMAKNIRVLGNALGLNQVEQDLIHLVVLSRLQLSLQECLDSIGGLNRAALITLFARVLNLKAIDVARALDSSSFLMRGGLLELDDAGNYPFSNKVDLLVGISDQLSTPQRHELGLFRNSFHIAPKPSLGLEDYPHLSTDLAILLPYLREALWTRKKGVNILVHGSPGTGKTEFARAAAKRLGSTLHEVACEDLRREPVEGQERFRGYRLAQGILANGRENLILFDEIEDVFRPQEDKLRGRPSNQSGMKGWVNRVLEDNQVPAFWITNRLHVLDEAFVRRFDLVIELNVPPRCVRKRILDARLQSLDVSEAVKARLADHEGLSPAVITRAASVIQDALSDGLSLEVGEALSHVIGRTLESMGHRAMAPAGCQSPTSYRPEVLNTDCNLDQVLGGLRQHGSGRLCLYGPPGTGKSAWGRHVAQKMDRPLLLKRASDLLDKYVGGTEVRIAAMFREAQAEKAVLLLDEADSFLQDRRQAQQSWEVTQVNELLTQMEAFEGVFIASTNLMDQLDAAALRRFDFKVKFTFLNPEQARILFLDATTQLGLNPTGEHLNHLDHLRKLTPGDFATVLRQARMAPPSDVPALLHRLEAECRLKPEARSKPIGFGPVAYETSTSLRINPSTQTGRSHGIH
jgi:SpoVK/Ycf46/Vps4 family AAA+-type ATPase